MKLLEVNEKALQGALSLLDPAARTVVEKTYQLLNTTECEAFKAGEEQGKQAGYEAAQVADRKDAFEDGWSVGFRAANAVKLNAPQPHVDQDELERLLTQDEQPYLKPVN